MWPTRQYTPKQLGISGISGAIFSMLAFWLAVILRPKLHLGPGGGVARIGLTVVLIIAMITPLTLLGYRAAFLLREGIRVQRWQQEQVEELRRVVQHPIWMAAVFLALAVGILGQLFREWHSIFSAAWVFLWMPITVVFWLRHALPKPPPPSYKIFQ